MYALEKIVHFCLCVYIDVWPCLKTAFFAPKSASVAWILNHTFKFDWFDFMASKSPYSY